MSIQYPFQDEQRNYFELLFPSVLVYPGQYSRGCKKIRLCWGTSRILTSLVVGVFRQQQHEAATKVQSVQRGRSQRQKYTSRVAQERLRRRRLPPFLNLYVESTGGSASPLRERTRAAAVDAGVLAQFCGQYDRVDEVDGRKVKGAKVSHYAVRATDALPSGCSLNAARTARFFLPLVLNAPPLRARFAAPR